jgi:hypothetical protein
MMDNIVEIPEVTHMVSSIPLKKSDLKSKKKKKG